MVIVLVGLLAGLLQGDPGPEEILKRMEEGLAQLTDFTVTLNVEAHLERVSIPPMHIVMSYKVPGRVHFDADGFALVPREGVPWSPSWLRERFRPESAAPDSLEGRRVYRMELEPRDDRAKARRVTVWVDPSRWTMSRVATAMVDGRSVNATFDYERVDGMWLPSFLTLRFSAPASDTTSVPEEPRQGPPRMRTGFGRGTVEIRYTGYKVNTGLSDEIFEPPAGKEP